MRVRAYIGVNVPAHLELARQTLIGMRRWCEEHPEIGLNIFSESGMLSVNFNVPEYMNLIGAIIWRPDDIIDMQNLTPNIVGISNRSTLVNYPQVITDDRATGRMAVDYFMRLGYRTIAFLGRKDLLFSVQREAGYRERMLQAGLEPHIFHHQQGLVSKLNGFLMELLECDAQVALVCAADNLALDAFTSLDEPQHLVPSRLAVLGVDCDILYNALCPVSLSSIRLSGERIGYQAADLVYRIHNGSRPPDSPILIPPQSVQTRQSTCAFAVEDPLVRQAMELINTRIAELHDVAAVVKALATARRTLETRFRASTGRTLHEELNSSRLNRARKLLATTDLSIKEVAELVGFQDQRRLSVAFRRLLGETPTHYRQRLQWSN